MTDNLNILEINEADFEEKVLKDSSSLLILVDFWAPWCGPCKQLTPLLEKVVNNSNGKVKLVKINIDENQQIAAQLRIQSIPAVFAFKDGQPVDAFQGVIPEKKIIEFIEKSLGEKLEEDHTNFYESIKNLINNRKASSTRNFHNKVTARTESKAMEYFTRCRRHHIRRIILTAIYQLFRTQYDKCTAWCAS